MTYVFRISDSSRVACTMQSTSAFLLLNGFSVAIKLDHKISNEFHHIRSHACSDVQTKAVRDLLTWLLLEHASKFDVVVQPPFGPPYLDEFEYKTTAESKLQIKGTSGVACSLGLQHFLKNYCHAHISWSGDQLKIPKPFPTVKDLTRITLPYRCSNVHRSSSVVRLTPCVPEVFYFDDWYPWFDTSRFPFRI